MKLLSYIFITSRSNFKVKGIRSNLRPRQAKYRQTYLIAQEKGRCPSFAYYNISHMVSWSFHFKHGFCMITHLICILRHTEGFPIFPAVISRLGERSIYLTMWDLRTSLSDETRYTNFAEIFQITPKGC